MSGQLENNTRQHVGMPPSFITGHGCMDHLTNKRSFDSQDTLVIDVLGFQKMLSMGICTSRHLQTFGHPVQDLNIRTVVNERSMTQFMFGKHLPP